MSDARRKPEAMPPTNEPLRIAVRRMRWFKSAFKRHVAAYGRDIGCAFEVDDAKLGGVFVRWLRAIEAQKPADKSSRKDYFEFVSSLMLRELTQDMPIKALGAPTRVGSDSAAAFWPEGYVSTLFCLSVHSAAMQQEFNASCDVMPAIDELRHWWSFRENARVDPSFSAGFLQMVLGRQPNWMMPDVFRARFQEEAARHGI